MDQSPYYGIEDSCNCQEDGDEVQWHGKCQIAFNGEHHSFCKKEEVGEFMYVIIDQGYICRIYGNITAYTSHGNTYQGFFQGRGIVDPVAYHADLSAGLLTVFYPV